MKSYNLLFNIIMIFTTYYSIFMRMIPSSIRKYRLVIYLHLFLRKLFSVFVYHIWIRKNEPSDETIQEYRERAGQLSYRPKISIITPVWNTNEEFLRLAIESVRTQVYDNWELCIVDGGSTLPYISKILKKYSDADERIRITTLTDNFGISGNSNYALASATGEFVGFLDHDDVLAPHALYSIVTVLNNQPDLSLVYTDEDKIDEKGKRSNPFFKPDWSPDYFLSVNYICHFTLIRKSILTEIGGFRREYDGAQDYDLFLRAIEMIKPTDIGHIPQILYHWRTHSGSTACSYDAKPYAIQAGKNAISAALKRRGVTGEVTDGLPYGLYRVKYHISGNPKISIIIPSKDKMSILKYCIESIRRKTTYQNYEIIIIDNSSTEPETFSYYQSLKKDPKMKIFSYHKPFNYSAINNFGVSNIETEFIVFLNNDTEVISEDWLSAMLEHAQRTEVGAVGAKLVFPNNTIQHAGVIIGINNTAGHSHKGYLSDNVGYFGRISLIGNFSAVSGACMMLRRDVFNQVGGFNELLTVAYNDVDLCLKIRQKGYLIVYTPYAELYHYESLSRGAENNPEKLSRSVEEIKYLKEQWKTVFERGDPYYNPNLTLAIENFSIRI